MILIQAEYYALEGLSQEYRRTCIGVTSTPACGPSMPPTMADKRTRLSEEVEMRFAALS